MRLMPGGAGVMGPACRANHITHDLRDLDRRNAPIGRREGQNHARAKTNFANRFKRIPMACPGAAKFLFRFFGICGLMPPSRLIEEGRTRRHEA
jgi:hypothetical protein